MTLVFPRGVGKAHKSYVYIYVSRPFLGILGNKISDVRVTDS